MANRRRGETAATIAGRRYTLCLTLGGLAELEDQFGAGGLATLGDRFGARGFSASDLVTLLRIGLAGGGCPVPEAEIRAWPAAHLPDTVAAVAALLRAAFGDDDPDPSVPQDP